MFSEIDEFHSEFKISEIQIWLKPFGIIPNTKINFAIFFILCI